MTAQKERETNMRRRVNRHATTMLVAACLFVAAVVPALATDRPAEEAKSLGLPVTTEMPGEVYELMRLFPQPTRTRPSVEYVPIPYRRPEGS